MQSKVVQNRVGDAAEPDKLLPAVNTECSVHRKHACLTRNTLTMGAMPSALAEMRMMQCNARAFNHQHHASPARLLLPFVASLRKGAYNL